jgi:hypothetical protein
MMQNLSPLQILLSNRNEGSVRRTSHDSKLNSDRDHILIPPIFNPYYPTLQIPMYLLMAQLIFVLHMYTEPAQDSLFLCAHKELHSTGQGHPV